MIQLKISNKSDFIGSFLSPISKLTENTVIKIREKEYISTSTSNDGTLIVNCIYEQDSNIDETIFLNVPDINKFIKVLSCISSEEIELMYNNNNIEHKSKNVGFKYHLLEDGIIDPPAVDIAKIKQIEFTTSFSVDYNTINQLVKASTFTTDTDKIYFYSEGDSIYATLTDKQRHNVDSFTQSVSEKYTGEEISKDLPIGFETIRVISTIRFDSLKVHINSSLNVFLFKIKCNKTNITIVSSGFIA